jgi:hypothetical protein
MNGKTTKEKKNHIIPYGCNNNMQFTLSTLYTIRSDILGNWEMKTQPIKFEWSRSTPRSTGEPTEWDLFLCKAPQTTFLINLRKSKTYNKYIVISIPIQSECCS